MNDWIANIDPKTLIAAFSAVVSLGAAAVSIHANWRSRKLSEASIRIAEFNASQAHRKAIFEWASRCQDATSEAYTYFTCNLSDSGQISSILTDLTALIDTGRWLLPNKDHDKYGQNKQAAYSGIRQLPLDCLVEVYDLLLEQFLSKNSGNERTNAETIENRIRLLKREFTSAIQERLEPRVFERELAKLRSKAPQ